MGRNPTTTARSGGGGSTGFEPKAEDLFDVPIDKQSKKTADGDFSPMMTDEDDGGFSRANEVASKALDFPISAGHSP